MASNRYDFELIKQTVDLLDLIGSDTDLKKVGSNEYAGPCPKCGGKDRFRVNLVKGWFCRKCQSEEHWNDQLDYIQWRDNVSLVEAYKKLGGNHRLTEEESARLLAERTRRDQERQAEEQRQQEERRRQLNQNEAWREYYDGLTLETRQLWHQKGLSDLWIDYFQVGYCQNRTFFHDDKAFTSHSLTIPTFHTNYHFGEEPELTWDCIGLVHRLLIDDPPGGKYRPHLAGAGKPLFNADLYAPIHGDVMLIEGEIKAMVTWAYLQEYVYKRSTILGRTQVVGIAGKSFNLNWADEFAEAEHIYICLDPDASEGAARIAKALDPERCSILDLPDKIDDMLVAGTLEVRHLAELIDTARRVKRDV